MKKLNEGLKWYANKFNTFYHFSDWQTLRVFHILPGLQVFYDTKGFYEIGPPVDDKWCKELIIRFSFIFWEFSLSFYWDHYVTDLEGI